MGKRKKTPAKKTAKKTGKKKAGREFEELVARIEEVLSPAGAVVTSPDKLKDHITGGRREVDASIRLPSGEICTVECRDRWTCKQGIKSGAKQDVLWIEQLVTKRADLRVSKTIGVSVGGFTKSAITKASHYGIDLRQMSQIADAEIAQQWVGGFRISVVVPEYAAVNLRIVNKSGDVVPIEQLQPTIAEAILADPTATGFLRWKNADLLISAVDLLNFSGPPPIDLTNDQVQLLKLSRPLSGDDWTVDTLAGRVIVSRVDAIFQIFLPEFDSSVQAARRYSSMKETLLDQVDAVADLGDASLQMTISGELLKPFLGQQNPNDQQK